MNLGVILMQKPADNQFAIHDLLKNRWSPRAFSRELVPTNAVASLFEAARWSPSAGNRQPWAFVAITLDDAETHQKLVETMTGRNPLWAKNVPLLIVTLAHLNPEKPESHRFAYYDLGQAVAHLSVQAVALGLHAHQMGGFDRVKARELLAIPDDYELMTIIAVGYAGSIDDLREDLRENELAGRTRKPLEEIVYHEHWNRVLETGEVQAV
jgi:nitroreductase